MAGHAAVLKLRGAAGCSLAAMDSWQEFDQAEMAGTTARLGAGGPLGGIVAVERERWVATRVAGMPAGLKLRGAAGMQLGGTDGWQKSDRARDGWYARTPGGWRTDW